MNLPNVLTISRFFLTFVFIYYLLQAGFMAKMLAALMFLLASLTDFLDGYLARKRNLITDFGKLMDPIADKFLILAAFLVFAQMHIVALWMVVLIGIREIFITVHRLFVVKRGKVVAAEKAGKIKTIGQIGLIAIILFYLILGETKQLSHADLWIQTINFLMAVIVIITIYSGFSYWSNQRLISSHA